MISLSMDLREAFLIKRILVLQKVKIHIELLDSPLNSLLDSPLNSLLDSPLIGLLPHMIPFSK